MWSKFRKSRRRKDRNLELKRQADLPVTPANTITEGARTAPKYSENNGHFFRISAINIAGDANRGSEDEIAINDELGCAWVIDGASPLGSPRAFGGCASEAQWYARRLSSLFQQQGTPTNPSFMFEEVINQIAHQYVHESKQDVEKIARHQLPSASALWCRWETEMRRLTFCGLGDCVGIALTDSGQIARASETLSQAQEQQNLRDWLETQSPDQIWQRVASYREKMNQPDGYWIFSIHPQAAHYAPVERFRFDTGERIRILLMSDGFYRLVQPYQRFSEVDLIDFISKYGLESAIQELRSYETSDADNRRYGRLKRQDDASACYFEINC